MTARISGSHGESDFGDYGGGGGGGAGVNIYRVGGAAGATGGGGRAGGHTTRRVPPAKRKKSYSTSALATYSWGMESRKGGVREKFIATIDAADMVKVRRAGPFMIMAGTRRWQPCAVFLWGRLFRLGSPLRGMVCSDVPT